MTCAFSPRWLMRAVQPVVDSEYPFGSIADAFAALERGRAKGKIVVILPAARR
jgi:alcohol dehydrogenase